MGLGERVKSRVVEPAVLRLLQWRGDPVARMMLPATKADPYPLYAQLRQRGLVRSPLGLFAAADHATVASILRDRRFSSSPVHQPGYRPPSYPPGDPRAGLPAADLLTMDPPDHTRLRRLVAGAFTPRAIAGLEPWIREVTVRLLTAADGAAGFDLIDALAFPLPIAVICHLLGVPAEDQAQFRAWGHDVAATLDPQTAATAQAQTRAAELALTGYLQDLVRKRRTNPDDSILSALIAAEEEGDRLSSSQVVSTALLLLIAGFETTVNLIGNGTVALLGDPDSWNRLRQDPALVPAAIEEMLRYDSPVQLTARIATEDVEVGGSVIPAGLPSSCSSAAPTATRGLRAARRVPDRPAGSRPAPVLLTRHASLPRRLAGPARGPHCHRGADPAVPGARAGRPADPALAARAARLRERSRPRHGDAIAVRRLSAGRRWHAPPAVRPDSARTDASTVCSCLPLVASGAEVTFTPSDRSLFARSDQMPIRIAAHEALGRRFDQPLCHSGRGSGGRRSQDLTVRRAAYLRAVSNLVSRRQQEGLFRNRKRPLTCTYLVAGAGFEPATSGL